MSHLAAIIFFGRVGIPKAIPPVILNVCSCRARQPLSAPFGCSSNAVPGRLPYTAGGFFLNNRPY
jgi:hypothetical protein